MLLLDIQQRQWVHLRFENLCESYGFKRKPTTVGIPQANAILECVHQVIGRCYIQLKWIWPNKLPLMTSLASLTMQHGRIPLPIRWYLKPYKAQLFLDKTCSSTFCLWLTGTKLDKGNHWLIVVISARIFYALTTTRRSEIKYLLIKKYPLQSRVQIWQGAMDYNNGSY